MTPGEAIQILEDSNKINWTKLTLRALQGAAPLVTALMMFNRKRPTDWLGLGLAGLHAVSIGRDVYDTLRENTELLYETDDEGRTLFVELPFPLRKVALHALSCHKRWVVTMAGAHSPQTKYYVYKVGSSLFLTATTTSQALDSKETMTAVPSVYVLRQFYEESLDLLRESFWGQFENRHLRMTEWGLEPDFLVSEGLVVTSRMESILAHVQKFLDAGTMRSYLFEGPPGTGKSTLIQYLIRETGFRTLRIDVSQFNGGRTGLVGVVIASLKTLVSFVRPEMIVVDDIDLLNSRSSRELLEAVEWCRNHVKIFVASANNRQRMTPALLRAGRFDEIMQVDVLEEAVIRSILGPDLEFERFKTWPIVYLLDLKTKIRILGKEEALKGVEETTKRIKEIQERILSDWKHLEENECEV